MSAAMGSARAVALRVWPRPLWSILLALACAVGAPAYAEPVRYTGSLSDGGAPADGVYALRLTLYATASGGKALGHPVTLADVPVDQGEFSAEVDFGHSAAALSPLWLQVEVADAQGRFEAVPERVPLAAKAAAADACWSTGGNAGTLATRDFIGTVDNQGLVFKVNNARALALTPFGPSLNVIAGHPDNRVAAGQVGAVIAGGGNAFIADPGDGYEGPNVVLAPYGTISGGAGNQVGDPSTTYPDFATIAGGRNNRAAGRYSFVAGGTHNWANGYGSFAGGTFARVRGPGEGAAAVVGDAGSFVWADAQALEFASTDGNQFLVRAVNGVAFNGTPPRRSRELTVWGNGNIDGNVDIHLRPQSSTFGYSLVVDGSTSANTNFILRHTDGDANATERLRVDANGDLRITGNAFKPGGGGWAVSSDVRLKYDVAPVWGALERLLALRGVQFRYRNPDAWRPSGVQTGFVAQEVQKVFPAWVERDAEGFLAVAPRGFEALAVEALRELAEENVALQAANTALEARLTRLERAVAGDR